MKRTWVLFYFSLLPSFPPCASLPSISPVYVAFYSPAVFLFLLVELSPDSYPSASFACDPASLQFLFLPLCSAATAATGSHARLRSQGYAHVQKPLLTLLSVFMGGRTLGINQSEQSRPAIRREGGEVEQSLSSHTHIYTCADMQGSSYR